MIVGLTFIAIGVVAWLISYALKDLFVNTSDDENPFRRLAAGVGYIGLAVAAWGVFLLVFFDR